MNVLFLKSQQRTNSHDSIYFGNRCCNFYNPLIQVLEASSYIFGNDFAMVQVFVNHRSTSVLGDAIFAMYLHAIVGYQTDIMTEWQGTNSLWMSGVQQKIQPQQAHYWRHTFCTHIPFWEVVLVQIYLHSVEQETELIYMRGSDPISEAPVIIKSNNIHLMRAD